MKSTTGKLVLNTKCPHGKPWNEECQKCGTRPQWTQGSILRIPASNRKCVLCGRQFRQGSWEKGYQYLRHNRVKNQPSAGWCAGMKR
jgi:hypothetical protein